MKKLGLSVCSLFSLQDAPEVDVLSYSTDSRGVAPQEAYRRVNDAFTRLGKGADFCNKRIDSTLRGNIGAEIDAIAPRRSTRRRCGRRMSTTSDIRRSWARCRTPAIR